MTLAAGIAELGLSLPTATEGKLEAFMALLAKWNKSYNLTAIRDRDQMVTHHLLDSLAVLPHLGAINTLADVGSGAGLPGLTLAIARPELRVTSVEASQKKVAFQHQAKIELKLTNVSIHCGRVERLKGVFDGVISRAFSDLAEFVGLAGHLSGRLLAMKGAYPEAEIAALPAGWRLAEAVKLNVPGLAAERHLLILERT
ncbi:MAG: 16S rRNA (guanine(527)-N(7))-methyltransferase RsmG [Rhodocyclaceae bacterium]|nr:16S rRNA (guanine(527)-N(7))-methyltransferase RsmG [Rhodocyclaceae bacterium]MBK7814667.1 16S rRNA (guanine(527)-N(7))-methyltransferase RsmG [Rhodocyclaceae bacterium]